DRPEFARDAVHALLAAGEIADIELVDGDAGLGLELARRGVIAGIVRRNAATLAHERDRNRMPNAPRAPRDHRNPSHVPFPLRPLWDQHNRNPRPNACRPRIPIKKALRGSCQSRATHMATPMPPPMHSVARPFLASRRAIS